ncbi:MAG: adenylate/guanylate cyclase domain-containing protein [Cyanobacteria bacterium RUI128]|nr:adenylate/guanylate cyclase domain-containing protein [Cyanobacteria bacterium RUI128]
MRFIKFLLIVISVLVFLWLAYWASDTFIEPKAYNYMVKNFTAYKHGSPDIVLVVIDDKSVGRHRWPWKRELYCGIFDYFTEYTNAKLVIHDTLLITEEDKVSDAKYFNSLKRVKNLIVGMIDFPRPYLDEHMGELYDAKFKEKFDVGITDLRIKPQDYPMKSLAVFPKPYFDAIQNVGSIKVLKGSDGYVTAAMNATNYKGTIYPSIALRAYMKLNNDEPLSVTDKHVIGANSKIQIPLLKENSGIFSLIRFYKPNVAGGGYSHKAYSAIDIMDSFKELKAGEKPLIDPKEFDGKIVMVGANVRASASGLSDIKRTPVSDDHSGLDVQATTLDNYLNRYFMCETPKWLNSVITLLLMALSFLIIRNFNLFVAISAITTTIVLYILLAGLLYRNGYAISTITPISMVIITMIFAYSYRYILEDKNKEKIKSAMGKYISEDIMKNVVQNIDELKLGGKKANVTVLFADIRGFTSMSEKLSADEVSVILNEYFTEIEPIVTRYNGVINKFIGDAVMAIFGEPIQDENHPKNAVRCACEMLDKVKELQAKWLDEGKPKIEIGIGINTGEAFVGNIGSERRMEYTVIGDMVNLASRIEGNNKTFKTNLLISASTYASAKSIVDTVKISNVKIRGKEKVLDLYEVIKLIN